MIAYTDWDSSVFYYTSSYTDTNGEAISGSIVLVDLIDIIGYEL